MRVLLSAFACHPGYGSEPGTGWHWVGALADLGHEVTVLTMFEPSRGNTREMPAGCRFSFHRYSHVTGATILEAFVGI